MMQHLPLKFKRTAADELPIVEASGGGSVPSLHVVDQDLDNVPIDGSNPLDTPWVAGDYVVFRGDPTVNGTTNLEFVDTGVSFFTVWNEYTHDSPIVNSLSGGATITSGVDGTTITVIPANSGMQFLRIGHAVTGAFTSWNANDYVGFPFSGSSGGGGGGSVLQATTVDVAAADIITLDTIDVELVPAQGANIVARPDSFDFSFKKNTVDHATAGQFVICWGASVSNIQIANCNPAGQFFGSNTFSVVIPDDINLSGVTFGRTQVANKAITLHCDAAITGSGDGVLKITTYWRLVPLIP